MMNPTSPASPAEAIAHIIARIAPVATEKISLEHSAGHILAAPICSDRPSPACDVSAMDGYAVRLADLAAGRIPVAGEILIGREPPPLAPGTTLRIVTGAPIPAHADAVIRREDVTEHPRHIEISSTIQTKKHANIRFKGENAAANTQIAPAGEVISPPLAAALAAFGYATVLVHRPLRIAIITTGDEVLPVDAAPSVWQLRNSNSAALHNMLSSARWIAPPRSRHAPDDPAAIERAIAEALDTCDALFLTGGVSMGTRDFIPSILRTLGTELLFHRLPQRPGKPLLSALSVRGQPIFGLPGNPISVLTTARRIGIPVLQRLAGAARPTQAQLVQVDNNDDRHVPLWWHRPARLTAPGCVSLITTAGSGDVAGTALSDGFIELPPHQTANQPVPLYLWHIQ